MELGEWDWHWLNKLIYLCHLLIV